ncbi:MAG: hypothetical protein U0R27_02105 [Candidatus Nanopelagicales bacterium]
MMGPEPDDELVIITEWIPRAGTAEFLDEPMDPARYASTVAQAARAISSAHARGCTHGRLRPSALMLLLDGSVRVRGHGVDAGSYGRDPDSRAGGRRHPRHRLAALAARPSRRGWPFDTDVGLPAPPGERAMADPPEPFRGGHIPEPLCRIIDHLLAAGTRLWPRSPLSCDSRRVRSVTDPAGSTARTP